MTDGPPAPRYRVVEKGRRLVVIDTRTDQPAARSRTAPPAVEKAPFGPERIAFDGRSTLVTRRIYDDKAPRRLVLDEGTTIRLENGRNLAIGGAVLAVVLAIFVPVIGILLLVAAGALANGTVRAAIRRGITAWLDRFDAE